MCKDNKFLVGTFAVDIRNGSLNGSSNEAENVITSSKENISYTKKIKKGGDMYAFASAPWLKWNLKKNAENLGQVISKIIKNNESEKQEAIIEANPFKNYDEDLYGFMVASNEILSEEEYQALDDSSKSLYKKETKKKVVQYKRNITKKRKAVVQFSPLQSIGKTNIVKEFCTKSTDGHSLLFSKETYSSIMSASFNLDFNRLGRFIVAEDESGFRDYTKKEILRYGYKEENGVVNLKKEDKEERLFTFLDTIETLNTTIRQTNNLEDLSPQFVILTDFKIGINPFIHVFRDGDLNIDYLIETIKQTNRFRINKIFIGVKSGFMGNLKGRIETAIKDNGLENEVILDNVYKSFESYKKTI